MIKVIRKYLGVLAALPFLLAPTISGAFELPTFAVGVGLTGAAVHVRGTETDPEGTKNPKKIYDSKGLEYLSIFGEARFNVKDRLGLTLGLSVLPGDAEFVTESKPDTDLTSEAGGTNTGTSTVKGNVSGHATLYIQPTVRVTDMFTVYLTAGVSRMDVEANAVLVTSTDFVKSVKSNGTHFGGGVMAEMGNGFFIKLEGLASDYDDVSYTTSDATTAKAELDSESVSFLLGKAF